MFTFVFLYFSQVLCYNHVMRFELDDTLIAHIIFCMEDRDSIYLFDTQECQIVNLNDHDAQYDDGSRFISIPDWDSGEGYRLMEHFTAGLKSPALRHELSAALNRNRGVFRAFKDVMEKYPEIEKKWFKYKDDEMKEAVIVWYNSLREEWGLEPVGIEDDDNSSLVMEDFIIREGKASDYDDADKLHSSCIKERKERLNSLIMETLNPFVFPGDFCFAAENAAGDFAGFLSAVFNRQSAHIRHLEVKNEYRGMGIGKALLERFLKEVQNQKLPVTIDLASDTEFFSRALHLAGFKPCLQRFSLNFDK